MLNSYYFSQFYLHLQWMIFEEIAYSVGINRDKYLFSQHESKFLIREHNDVELDHAQILRFCIDRLFLRLFQFYSNNWGQ